MKVCQMRTKTTQSCWLPGGGAIMRGYLTLGMNFSGWFLVDAGGLGPR